MQINNREANNLSMSEQTPHTASELPTLSVAIMVPQASSDAFLEQPIADEAQQGEVDYERETAVTKSNTAVELPVSTPTTEAASAEAVPEISDTQPGEPLEQQEEGEEVGQLQKASDAAFAAVVAALLDEATRHRSDAQVQIAELKKDVAYWDDRWADMEKALALARPEMVLIIRQAATLAVAVNSLSTGAIPTSGEGSSSSAAAQPFPIAKRQASLELLGRMLQRLAEPEPFPVPLNTLVPDAATQIAAMQAGFSAHSEPLTQTQSDNPLVDVDSEATLDALRLLVQQQRFAAAEGVQSWRRARDTRQKGLMNLLERKVLPILDGFTQLPPVPSPVSLPPATTDAVSVASKERGMEPGEPVVTDSTGGGAESKEAANQSVVELQDSLPVNKTPTAAPEGNLPSDGQLGEPSSEQGTDDTKDDTANENSSVADLVASWLSCYAKCGEIIAALAAAGRTRPLTIRRGDPVDYLFMEPLDTEPDTQLEDETVKEVLVQGYEVQITHETWQVLRSASIVVVSNNRMGRDQPVA